MTLSRREARALTIAGFALAHGVWCAAAGRRIGPLLIADLDDQRCRIPLSAGDGAPWRAAAILDALGDRVGAAALLTSTQHPSAIAVRAWTDDAWAWLLALPYSVGDRLTLHGETLLAQPVEPDRRAVILDALYDGVGLHAKGLEAWVEAEVAV